MGFAPGARIGPYEVLAKIGEGGMGEVYLARDTKLQRDVAIKVLPELFALDPERLTRFEREAQTLAALNHPNIAQIYGTLDIPAASVAQGLSPARDPSVAQGFSPARDASAGHALVMEFVDGEDLAQRLARGPVPIDETLTIARQVIDALEAAHERGIVHRDLKPANIKLSSSGVVKVLDFGLAKAMDPVGREGTGPAIMNSPTFTSPAMHTQMGVILGTAAYMAPEQARGKAVDKRADIWAFGLVVFEMLTGRQTFDGDTVSDVMAAVMKDDPDWSRLPQGIPPQVVRLLKRCLVKDPKHRLRDIGDARLLLDDAEVPAPSLVDVSRRSRRDSSTRLLSLGALVASIAAIGTIAYSSLTRVQPALPSAHLSIALPEGDQVTSVPARSCSTARVTT